MTEILVINLNSVFLLNVSDIIMRNVGSEVGILLGTREGDQVFISTSFEMLVKGGEENGIGEGVKVSEDFLQERLAQFSSINPQLCLVGVYQVGNSTPTRTTLALIEKIRCLNIALTIVVTIFDVEALKRKRKDEVCHSFVVGDTWHSLRTKITPEEVENIATSTILNHLKYSDDKNSSAKGSVSQLDRHNQELADSVSQLSSKINKITSYFNNVDPTRATDADWELWNSILYLSKKLATFKQSCTPMGYNDQLRISKLSLLTNQLVALENIKTQISNSITRYGIHSTSNKFDIPM